MRRLGVRVLTAGAWLLALVACGLLLTSTATPIVLTQIPTAVDTPTATVPTDEPTLPAIEPSSPGGVQGLVWKDRCLLTGGEGGEPLVLGQGCASTGPNPWEWGANQIYEPGFEPGIGGVTIHLGVGACPVIGLTSTVTAGDGRYAFAGLPPGTYCVSFDALNDGNDAILIPGGLSYAVRGGDPQTTITVDAGELEVVDFGWTYQFGD